MFQRVLIANRGEIAARVIRACTELGIDTVAVHSEADSGAPWLSAVGSTVCIGPPATAHSYLDADAVLQAAEQTESCAIHPGYGLLSENAVFAARCFQHGITFIGPGPGAIRTMGDKITAKRTMAAAGVPVIPGSLEPLARLEDAQRIAADAGYPVLLKASAGGGGKGMRLCRDAAGLVQGFAEATREAEKAFGNPEVYLESFIEGGRHIEFQVLADRYGHVIHLGERECSIQRSHQKLVEESPSPAITAEERAGLGERVAAASAAIGYVGAGTLEFLRAPDGRLFFMEMNTRLQVEHPVTEMVTGIDIVKAQIAIAAGEPLRAAQTDVSASGHAIEFRINAEDPDRGFRPDPGRIDDVVPPSTARAGARVRWESGIAPGWRVPPHYDSLLGKVIVHAATRAEAIASAREALSAMRITGVKTTIPFHLRLLDDASFAGGEYDIATLSRSGLGLTQPAEA